MRTATLSDAPGIRTMLAHAFFNDPVIRWFLPGEATRLESLAAWYGVFVDRYLSAPDAAPRARVVVSGGDVHGVALWRWPDDVIDAPGVLPTTEGLLAAFVGPEHAARVAAGIGVLPSLRPTTPHAYLHFLATAPASRGRGFGRALVEEGVARAAADGLPARLETMNPANVDFYARLGFEVIAEANMGEGPRVWVMATRGPGPVQAG